MKLATVLSRAESGVEAPLVRVEVNFFTGQPKFHMSGLPEAAVRESKFRVFAAIRNAGYEFPIGRIIVNLAPADLPKEGGRFDLPISVGILAASGQLPGATLRRFEFLGELSLGGDVRPLRGGLSASIAATAGGRALVLPADSAAEALLVNGARIAGIRHLLDLPDYLDGRREAVVGEAPEVGEEDGGGASAANGAGDLADIRGQEAAKRALEIAAAGGHSMLMLGPPGSGKTMLASRLPGILPTLGTAEALETAAVYSSSSHGFAMETWRRRPFRSPHHTASAAALVGGGSIPRPGEISLAHNGVLFLDELPEFERRVLETLREPIESGAIHISRAAMQARFPSRFQLVAAMNPCPCGYLGDLRGRCQCTVEQVQRYRTRISGPLLDRIDIQILVPPVAARMLGERAPGESSGEVRRRVTKTRGLQWRRQGGLNRALAGREMEKACALDQDARALLDRAMDKLALSPRSYHRILRLARTIADLDQAPAVTSEHIAEAVQLRCLDRGR